MKGLEIEKFMSDE